MAQWKRSKYGPTKFAYWDFEDLCRKGRIVNVQQGTHILRPAGLWAIGLHRKCTLPHHQHHAGGICFGEDG